MDAIQDWVENYEFPVIVEVDNKSLINVSIAVVIVTMVILLLLKYFRK